MLKLLRASQLTALCRLDRRNILIQRKNIRKRPNGCNREGVDLSVRLGIVVLDVQEVGRLLERWVIPVQIAHPLKAMSASLSKREDDCGVA